jgi:hypothetical protein
MEKWIAPFDRASLACWQIFYLSSILLMKRRLGFPFAWKPERWSMGCCEEEKGLSLGLVSMNGAGSVSPYLPFGYYRGRRNYFEFQKIPSSSFTSLILEGMIRRYPHKLLFCCLNYELYRILVYFWTKVYEGMAGDGWTPNPLTSPNFLNVTIWEK